MTTSQTPREQLLKDLRGRNLVIPDLQNLFRNWPQYVHPELERLRQTVDKSLTRFVFPCWFRRIAETP